MELPFRVFLSIVGVLLLMKPLPGSSQSPGNGIIDHGVAAPISNARGTVATIDGDGRNVVLTWLFDHRGGYALLMIDAETGKSEEFKMPFLPERDAPYTSILSSDNKFYTLFNSNFIEFDPVKKAFTFQHSVNRLMAMSMTQDDKGLIWAVTYPNSGLVSFNPKNREFKDYGHVYKQNWAQYPRSIAADNNGWVYFGVGATASQVVAFNPASNQAKPMFDDSERKLGTGYVYQAVNGKVYGQSLKGSEDWYEFDKGLGKKIDKENLDKPKPIITSDQNLFHSTFPDGKKLVSYDLTERKLIVEIPATKTRKEVSFDYSSDGAWTMGIGVSPNGKIFGGTTFPMRFFSYDPKKDVLVNRKAEGQFNALTRQGNSFFFAGYPRGFLLDWNNGKPIRIADCTPVIHRPHRLLAYPDGKTLIMSGTPDYGHTGGGLFFWDRKKKTKVLLKDSQVVVNQSTMSLVALPNGKVLGGTTTSPGTGGERKAFNAELYIMDFASKKLDWKSVVIPGVQSYTDLFLTSNGLVYGIADRRAFFVFDLVKKEIVYKQDLMSEFGITAAEQSPRVFIADKKGEVYILFRNGIGRVEKDSFKISFVVKSPVPIDAGGDYLDGRIYFISGSHIYSYTF